MTVSFTSNKGLQIGPLLGHLCRDLNLRVEVPDALLGLVAHPLAVVAHILR